MQVKVTTGKAVAQFVLGGEEISIEEVLQEALGRHDVKLRSVFVRDTISNDPLQPIEITLWVEFSYGKSSSFADIALSHA